MRKLTVLAIIFMFILASIPVFAEEKPHPKSPFNGMREWLTDFGKTPSGKSIFECKNKPSTLDPDEVKDRVRNVGGGKRGMGRY